MEVLQVLSFGDLSLSFTKGHDRIKTTKQPLQPMNTVIQVELVRTFQARIYVRSEEHKWINALTGKLTIDEVDMQQLKKAGYSFEWVTAEDVELKRIQELVGA